MLGEYAWNGGNAWARGEKYAHEVATKKPNAWGLYDMHGNVSEWCRDNYEADYFRNSPLTNPPGPAAGFERVLRGGSAYNSRQYMRSASRHGQTPSTRNINVGFRVAQDP